jgi:ribose-phosphate pyrophosphokinase
MKVLNLAYPEKSDIKYVISKFPDGQSQVKIIPDSLKYVLNDGTKTDWDVKFVEIKSRLNNFMDLELIVAATVSLRGLGVKEIHLYTPYFLGSRSDRKFEEGSNNYLKGVICPIINNLNFESVTVMDAHSDVLEACLNNFKKIDNRELVESFISDTNAFLDTMVLVSVDGGSLKKIYKVAEQINCTNEVVICSKHRGVDGKLNKTVVPINISDYENKNFIIIDDLLDGGASFINIAKEIKNKIYDYNVSCENDVLKNKIYLIVTHGIFSKGIGELMQYFDAIYTTNSYKDFMPDTKPFIKQLNVF